MLKMRFRLDAKCSSHPRYNPEKDGPAKDASCAQCEALYTIWLYVGIATRKARNVFNQNPQGKTATEVEEQNA